MAELSVLIGGRAGFGIDKASLVIARIFSRLGWRVYVYREYPSLIRGGHTFSIVRSSEEKISAHKNGVDVILALNQDAVDLHKTRLSDKGLMIYDSDSAKAEALPVGAQAVPLPATAIVKEEGAQEIVRNICLVGALCKAFGIDRKVLVDVLKKEFSKDAELNIKVANRGYDGSIKSRDIPSMNGGPLPIFTGNEAVGLGLVKAGLRAYVSYPMTPTSPVLHFLAALAEDFDLKVIHPESEIAAILMALGFAYCGQKAAVGTSGGGFCLMVEGLSFSAMSELPVVIVMGQRPGPSTGLPTFSSQSDLHFILNAGQGEFCRLIVAPGDAEEAYRWSQFAMNISWRYQVPSFILTDKTLGEGSYSFDPSTAAEMKEEWPVTWGRVGGYKRYEDTDNGVSPIAFVPDKDAVIKVNSYEHDEYGISTEDPAMTIKMQDKRLRKGKYLAEDTDNADAVGVYGDKGSKRALLCWGSNKGVCIEAAKTLGFKVVQPVVLSPFPVNRYREAVQGVDRLIAVENNATGQLARLVKYNGFSVDAIVNKYDGRPFTVDELAEKLKKII